MAVRLIVNADDFGISDSANRAIERAHREGILTSASLMVAGDAAAAAVQIARNNPRLGVGLHSVLVCGRSVLPPKEIPGLVDEQGRFTNQPVVAGMRYFFGLGLQAQVRREVLAQFERFQATGLALDHVNGHLNFHLHPGVFRVLLDEAEALGMTLDQHQLREKVAMEIGVSMTEVAMMEGRLAGSDASLASLVWLDG